VIVQPDSMVIFNYVLLRFRQSTKNIHRNNTILMVCENMAQIKISAARRSLMADRWYNDLMFTNSRF
jgi:hypothetical protein